jgi:hypothetical protein
MVGNPIDHFGIDDDLTKDDQVWSELTDLDLFLDNIERRLLLIGEITEAKFHRQGSLVGLFMNPVAKLL